MGLYPSCRKAQKITLMAHTYPASKSVRRNKMDGPTITFLLGIVMILIPKLKRGIHLSF